MAALAAELRNELPVMYMLTPYVAGFNTSSQFFIWTDLECSTLIGTERLWQPISNHNTLALSVGYMGGGGTQWAGEGKLELIESFKKLLSCLLWPTIESWQPAVTSQTAIVRL